MYCSYLIILFSVGFVHTSPTSTEDVVLPVEALNCIENLKNTHIKWLPVFEQCKLSMTSSDEEEFKQIGGQAVVVLLGIPNFRKCMGEEAVSEYDEAKKRCKIVGASLSEKQQKFGEKLIGESLKHIGFQRTVGIITNTAENFMARVVHFPSTIINSIIRQNYYIEV